MAVYMKLEGIDGSATDSGHEKWIPITSFQHGIGCGISSPQGAQRRECSSASISEVTVAKETDVSSSVIQEKLCTGTKVDKCILHFVTASGSDSPKVYLKYEFENCLFSGYSISSGGDRPTETISINFLKMRVEFTPYDDVEAGSPIRFGWDLGKDKPDGASVSE